MTTKAKSFTLSEMLVVLIITAIVVGLAFSVLTLVRKQIESLQKNADETTKIELLESKFLIDFNTYSDISILNEGSLLFKNEIDSINYELKENYIICNEDTLTNKLKEVTFYYKTKPVSLGKIDAIKIILEPKKEVLKTLFIYTSNDATEINEINLNGF